MDLFVNALLSLVFGLIGGSLTTFIREKSKNFATRQDIGKITAEVEKVKTEYASQLKVLEHRHSVLLDELQGKQQLRMAALEKRLQVHQEAFTLWRKLISKINERQDVKDVLEECNRWWDSNCLYLSANARKAFAEALFSAAIHGDLIQDVNITKDWKPAMENAKVINKAGAELIAAVELPSLVEREYGVETTYMK
ncbi:hypothetical protein [Glaciimonas soli]|uniref:Uncharacterized protein n=1 Tax=Glaciimonas soli TaxID=2590999 RepID=A0A843YT52_9BURK|nr:hypothetical protein [Glaciimonas soli]MQR02370.1 hypothetical protein [Glaciimonas soli]